MPSVAGFVLGTYFLWLSFNTATHFAETTGSKPGVQEQSVGAGAYNSVSLILKNTEDPTSLPLVGLSYLVLKSKVPLPFFKEVG